MMLLPIYCYCCKVQTILKEWFFLQRQNTHCAQMLLKRSKVFEHKCMEFEYVSSKFLSTIKLKRKTFPFQLMECHFVLFHQPPSNQSNCSSPCPSVLYSLLSIPIYFDSFHLVSNLWSDFVHKFDGFWNILLIYSRWPSLVPNSNQHHPEVTTLSLTTTNTITTKVTSAVGGYFRKNPPPPLPPRQMSLPPLSQQPPLIEDEGEDSATPTPSTTPTPKAHTSSVGSGGQGSGDPNTIEDGSIASIEAAVTIAPTLPHPMTAGVVVKDDSLDLVDDMVFKEVICQVKSSLNFGPSQISLSSWSSTASVATRTNTDNPASMSHIVTNFNISRTAAAAVHQDPAGTSSVQGVARGPTSHPIAAGAGPAYVAPPVGAEGSSATPASSAHSASSADTASRSRSSTSSHYKKLTGSGPSAHSSTTSATNREAAAASASLSAVASSSADEDKEYTPLRVFKQTPV